MHPRGAIKLPRLPMKRAKQMSTMAKINKSVCAHYLIYNVCIYTKYLFTDIFEKFSDWMIQRNIDRMWQQTYLQLLYISSEEKDIKLNTKWARTKETDSGRKWNTKHKKRKESIGKKFQSWTWYWVRVRNEIWCSVNELNSATLQTTTTSREGIFPTACQTPEENDFKMYWAPFYVNLSTLWENISNW